MHACRGRAELCYEASQYTGLTGLFAIMALAGEAYVLTAVGSKQVAGHDCWTGSGRGLVKGPSQDYLDCLMTASGLPTNLISSLPCRESTVLQTKLEDLANLIGKFGLGAAGFSLAAMAGTYSWEKFVVGGQSWDWSFASDYLHFVIIAITILVSLRGHAVMPVLCFAGLEGHSSLRFLSAEAAFWLSMPSTYLHSILVLVWQ